MESRRSYPAFKVLFVDADETLQTLIAAIFERHALVVEHAFNGATALRRLREDRFDALVLELMLPDISGRQVIAELKQRDPAILPRTVVLTAADDSALRVFDDAGLVRRVIRKPFDVSEFAREVLSCRPDAVPPGDAAPVEQQAQ